MAFYGLILLLLTKQRHTQKLDSVKDQYMKIEQDIFIVFFSSFVHSCFYIAEYRECSVHSKKIGIPHAHFLTCQHKYKSNCDNVLCRNFVHWHTNLAAYQQNQAMTESLVFEYCFLFSLSLFF